MRVQGGDVDDAPVALAHRLPRRVLHAEEDAIEAEIGGEVLIGLRQIRTVAGTEFCHPRRHGRPGQGVPCDVTLDAGEAVARVADGLPVAALAASPWPH